LDWRVFEVERRERERENNGLFHFILSSRGCSVLYDPPLSTQLSIPFTVIDSPYLSLTACLENDGTRRNRDYYDALRGTREKVSDIYPGAVSQMAPYSIYIVHYICLRVHRGLGLK
jgi:hypothetical protein